MSKYHLRKGWRRIIAMTLAVMMVVTAMPASAFDVFAAEEEIPSLQESDVVETDVVQGQTVDEETEDPASPEPAALETQSDPETTDVIDEDPSGISDAIVDGESEEDQENEDEQGAEVPPAAPETVLEPVDELPDHESETDEPELADEPEQTDEPEMDSMVSGIGQMISDLLEENADVPEEEALPEDALEFAEQTIWSTDEELNIGVRGNLPVGATLQAVAIPLEYAHEIAEAQDETEKPVVLFAYDITIYVNGEKFDPESYGETVTVIFKNLEDASEEIDVVHVKKDVSDAQGELDLQALAATPEELLDGAVETELVEPSVRGERVAFDLSSFSIVLGLMSEPSRSVEMRQIDVSIDWEGDIPQDFTYPESVTMIVERTTDGETWETVEDGAPFTVTPDADNQWTAAFSFPAAAEPGDETGTPLPYTYRIAESPAGLSRFLRSDAVIIGPEDAGTAAFTNTYNDGWDYTVDLYWNRSGDQRYNINTTTTVSSLDLLVYKMDIRTQKPYEGIPTTVSDEELLNPTSGLVIRVPLYLLQDRDGNWLAPYDFSIADDTAPTTDREFTYRIIGDEIVFYNYRSLPSSYTASYTVGYKVDPVATPDGTTASLHAESVGHYDGQPSTDDGRQSTQPITYRIDTGSYVTLTLKDDGCSLYYANGSISGMPMDTENYVYLWYIVRVNAAGNQPATMTVTDTPRVFDEDGDLIPGGEVVKVVKWKWANDKPIAPPGGVSLRN